MNRTLIYILLLSLALVNFGATIAEALEKRPADRLLPARYSMVGIRLGIWADRGDPDMVIDSTVDADFPSAGFYTEFFYDFRLSPVLLLEFSLAVASRGDVVLRNADDEFIGTINLYPLLAQVKFSPLSARWRTVHPFIIGGGGVVIGRQSSQFVRVGGSVFDPYAGDNTEADLIGVAGGGIDISLSEQIGLNFAAKYHPVTFNGALAGITDYSGISFSVGIAYFLHKKK